MKHRALMAVLGLIVGCNTNSGGGQGEADAKAASAQSATASKGTIGAKPKPGYFEMDRDGKTYVFGNVATMQKVSRGEQPSGLKTMPAYGPEGETVVFETDGAGLEQSLMKEYGKSHPKK